jgi:MFS family permease
MVVADVVRAVTQALLAVLLIAGDPPLGVLMAAAAVVGAGTAFSGPAITALLTDITPPEHLQQANALRGVAESLGGGLGPGIGGLVVATAGAGWAVGADALTYVVSAVCLAGLHIVDRDEQAHEQRAASSGFLPRRLTARGSAATVYGQWRSTRRTVGSSRRWTPTRSGR